jgi:hypothetical protein
MAVLGHVAHNILFLVPVGVFLIVYRFARGSGSGGEE